MNTNKVLTFILLVLLASTLKAAETNVSKPFSVVLGFGPPVSNYCRAIVTEAFKRLNREVVVKQLPAERSIQLANEGVDDADCTRIKKITQIYTNLIQVPEKIFDVHFVAFTRGDIKPISGWDGLKPHNVGAVYGWKLIEKKVAEVKPKSFTKVPEAESMFKMLDLGRIDVAMLSAFDGSLRLQNMGFNHIKMEKPPLASLPLYFSMNKKHANLVEPLTRVFKEMKADGTWEKIAQQELPFEIK